MVRQCPRYNQGKDPGTQEVFAVDPEKYILVVDYEDRDE
jgi:hypothetical protein